MEKPCRADNIDLTRSDILVALMDESEPMAASLRVALELFEAIEDAFARGESITLRPATDADHCAPYILYWDDQDEQWGEATDEELAEFEEAKTQYPLPFDDRR